MTNPFKLSIEKITELLDSYRSWVKANPQENDYIEKDRQRDLEISSGLLDYDQLKTIDDDELYKRIFTFSRKLEGPAYIRLGEDRLTSEMPRIRENLVYICNSQDDPLIVAENVIEGKNKIQFFAKSFWSPILQARFKNILPNWNNKTENFFTSLGINLKTNKLTISEKYLRLKTGFSFINELAAELDYFDINHLMHYGTAIEEGINLISSLLGQNSQPSAISMKNYWIIGAGEKAKYWDEFKNECIVSIGLNPIGDLLKYDSKDEIEQALQKAEGHQNRRTMDALAGFEFSREMKIGDIVIVKKGVSEYLGYGEILSDYQFDPQRDYKNMRQVKWIIIRNCFETIGQIPLKTLTKITDQASQDPKYKKNYQRIISLFEDPIDIPWKATFPLNQILYGPPGTGKTWETIDRAVEIIDSRRSDKHAENKRRFDELRNAGQIEFITFHQNYAYEDFVVGIRPDPNSEELHFIPHKGIFYRICALAKENYMASLPGEAAQDSFEDAFNEIVRPVLEEDREVEINMPSGKMFWIYEVTDRSIRFRKTTGSTHHTLSISTLKEIENGSREMFSGLAAYYQPLIEVIQKERKSKSYTVNLKRYVLIIDEINRANISRVFGELITLLEEDKRLGADNELKVLLPNGERNFSVPPNLYVIGTMNTADKSIALLDIALRRRFEFIGVYPKPYLIPLSVRDKITQLNNEIRQAKKSPDYMIGHAFFIGKSENEIVNVMNTKVIPLLYEYFNGRESYVKEILEKAGFDIEENQITYQWQVR